MSSMYEAMKKAAKDNPEFAQELDRAVKANEKRAADEAEAKRLKAAAAYREKMEREQREAQEKERIRREKEIKILSDPHIYPFAYSYPFFGKYSCSYGIVFADISDTARDMVVKKINEYFERMGPDYPNREEEYKLALERLHIYQLDLSDGIADIGEYYE